MEAAAVSFQPLFMKVTRGQGHLVFASTNDGLKSDPIGIMADIGVPPGLHIIHCCHTGFRFQTVLLAVIVVAKFPAGNVTYKRAKVIAVEKSPVVNHLCPHAPVLEAPGPIGNIEVQGNALCRVQGLFQGVDVITEVRVVFGSGGTFIKGQFIYKNNTGNLHKDIMNGCPGFIF